MAKKPEVTTFDSLLDMHDYLRDTPQNPAATVKNSTDSATDWNGGDTYDNCVAMMATGWDGPRSEVNEIASQITADAWQEMEQYRPSFHLDFVGGVVDMGRYMTGEPQNMLDFRLSPTKGQDKVVTIVVGACFSANINAETLLKRGAVVVALIDVLAATGRTVEVWVEASLDGRDRQFHTAVRVKKAEQHLDLDVMMYAIAHPGMLRRTFFATWERSANASDLGWGYGSVLKVKLAEQLGATVVLEATNKNNPPEVADPIGWITKVLDKVANNELVNSAA